MVSEADIWAVSDFAAQLDAGDVAVEFGPWLGALSLVIAPCCELHVVDNFEWTSAHAKRAPGLLAAGDSFRTVFERNLAERCLKAIVHQTSFREFSWSGGRISLVVIDGPKTAMALHECLRSVLPHIREGAPVLLKNGLTPAFSDMAGYLSRLVEKGILKVPPQKADPTQNLLHLTRGSAPYEYEGDSDLFRGQSSCLLERLALPSDHPFRLLPIVDAIRQEDWTAAFEALEEMEPSPQIISAWDKVERLLLKRGVEPRDLSVLSEVIAAHHSEARPGQALPFHKSEAVMYRAYWLNNADKPDRARSFSPNILSRAFEFGYMNWPSKVRDLVVGCNILDVGGGPGLHGLGYLTAGANSYLGLDPIVKLEKDRVKNLAASTKESFGWTPDEISARIPHWRVLPNAVQDLPEERCFDLSTLHNVTEHLHQLEAVFRAIAARLCVGGKILYNHHNYYAWNGHHLPPKRVDQIDLAEPAQRELVDWGHVEYNPGPDHYIARGLNRIRLDELLEITERYFVIERADEVRSSADTGLHRLSDEIRARYPYLTDRDFQTQNLLCVATVRT